RGRIRSVERKDSLWRPRCCEFERSAVTCAAHERAIVDESVPTLKVLVVNNSLFVSGGAETALFQERAFLTNTGIEVIDFVCSTSAISNRRSSPGSVPPPSWREH